VISLDLYIGKETNLDFEVELEQSSKTQPSGTKIECMLYSYSREL